MCGQVLLSIQLFLVEPNFDDPVQKGPYLVGKKSRAAYDQRVCEQAARYTMAEFDALVAQFCLKPLGSGLRQLQDHLIPDDSDDDVDPAICDGSRLQWTEDSEHRIVQGLSWDGCTQLNPLKVWDY